MGRSDRIRFLGRASRTSLVTIESGRTISNRWLSVFRLVGPELAKLRCSEGESPSSPSGSENPPPVRSQSTSSEGDAPTETDGEENLHHTGPEPIPCIHPA